MGGIQPKGELTEMNERDIARAKSKLRGAKVKSAAISWVIKLMSSSLSLIGNQVDYIPSNLSRLCLPRRSFSL